jgi:hypothetical protein
MIILQRQAQLFHVALALGIASGFTRRLHCREQQSHQHPDNDDNYQYLQKGDSSAMQVHLDSTAYGKVRPAIEHSKVGSLNTC